MNIALVGDENYAIYLYVAIASTLDTKNKDDKLSFFVFSPDLSDKSKKEILKLKEKYSFDIEFVKIDKHSELIDFPYERITYYRFNIPLYMHKKGIRKYLFSDCDIIVRESLSELYNTDLEGNSLGLVPCGWGDEEREFIPKLGLKKNHKYTYAGLMLVDVEKYIDEQKFEQFRNLAKAKGKILHWQDMDVLNLVCDGNKYKELPPRYSINPGFGERLTKENFLKTYKGIFPDQMILEALEHPVIWQLAGGAKPSSEIALPKVKQIFYNYTKGTVFEKKAKSWLSKTKARKFIKTVKNFFYKRKRIRYCDYVVKKYKICGLMVYKKIRNKPVEFSYISLKKEDRCLCICPHPDDEIIGLGGLLLKNAHNFDVLCLNSAGVATRELTAKERSDVRISEFEKVMKRLGVRKHFIYEGYDIPPMFKRIDSHMQDYLQAVNLKEYDYIFVPYIRDHHPEHQYATSNVFVRMAKKQHLKRDAKIVMYEVWTPMESPNCMLDIEDVIDEKIDVLKMYKSQIGDGWDYDRWTKALNEYRSMQVMGFVQTKYAEVYQMYSARNFLLTYKELKYGQAY